MCIRDRGYILPEKFHIDKRKAHLSNLIFSGQISKKEAVEELDKPIYDAAQLKIDKDFVLKKLELTNTEFENFIRNPRMEHKDFATEKSFYERFPALTSLKPLVSFTKRLLTN